MASNGNGRRNLLTAGGALSLVAGIFQINNGAVLVAYFSTRGLSGFWRWQTILFPEIWADFWDFHRISHDHLIWLMIMGVLFLVLGTLAVVGGVSAVRRKSFGLSLAGAISALVSGLFGILAVIFVGVARREFRAKGQMP